MNVPVTATAVSELIQRKGDNPKDFGIVKMLKLWKAEPADSSAQHNIGQGARSFPQKLRPTSHDHPHFIQLQDHPNRLRRSSQS